jgi:hypothetical protein
MEFILSAMLLNKNTGSKNTDRKLLNAARFETFKKNKELKSSLEIPKFTLMMETEEISETLVFNSTLTRLIAQEYFRTLLNRQKDFDVGRKEQIQNVILNYCRGFCEL